ncbi:MAG: 2-isopropylmalate synthase [Candidatus Kerfeldbacteria bacterium]|nr:2-isopropylmalate synthase [Candidatus Kerfeldbacteria bacterium]
MEKLYIFDTTMRDGEQVPGAKLNVEQKVIIAEQLLKLGVDVIEAGFPISSPGDFAAVEAVSQLVGDRAVVCALTRAVEADIDAAVAALRPAQRPRIHTGIGSSDIHIQYKFKSTRQQVLARGVAAVAYAKKSVEEVEFYAEDAGRADNDFLAQMIAAVIAAGATHVNIPDTTGYCMSEDFYEKIKYLCDHVKGIENVIISVHCHNDLGLATANTLAGIRAGARQAQVTVNGIGERAGNAALEEVVMALKTRRDQPFEINVHTKELIPISQLVSQTMGLPVQANKAIVGANAFAHSSGIHQDGILKHRQNYEIIDPKDVGADESKIILTARSGRAALRYRLQQLGFVNQQPEQVEQIYQHFLQVADQQKEVVDHDLMTIATNVKA